MFPQKASNNVLTYKYFSLFFPLCSTPKGLEDVSSYPTLFAELLGGGWTIDELTKLAGGNFLRVMQQVEKVRDDKKAAGVKPYEDHPNFRTDDPYNCTSS